MANKSKAPEESKAPPAPPAPPTESSGELLVRLVCQFRDCLQAFQEAMAEIDPATHVGGHPGHPRGDGTMLAGEIAKALLANGGRLPGNDGNALRHVVHTMTPQELQADPEMLARTAQVVRFICDCLITGHKSPHIGETELARYGTIFADHMHFSTARVALEEHNVREGTERQLSDVERMNANIAKMKAKAAMMRQTPRQSAPKPALTPQQMADRRFAPERRPGFGGNPAPNRPDGEFVISDALPSLEGEIGPPPGFEGGIR
jgi:hypothetical protein